MKDQEKDHNLAELPPGLYMVSTPIGNLEDLSARAVRVLSAAHWIAAEDTRETRKLLESGGPTTTKLISLHEHSGPNKIGDLVRRLQEPGAIGVYVSDAGTPGICDPGADLVSAAVAAGIPVVPVPGPSAPIALLSVSGFFSSKFTFHGFFPREKKDRETWAQQALQLGGLHVFFESPHRIKDCLDFLAKAIPTTSDQAQAPAQIVVGRELTKRFESIYRGTISQVAEMLPEPRGEYVVALDLGNTKTASSAQDEEKIRPVLAELAALGAGQKILVRVGMSHGLSKNTAYDLALQILQNNQNY